MKDPYKVGKASVGSGSTGVVRKVLKVVLPIVVLALGVLAAVELKNSLQDPEPQEIVPVIPVVRVQEVEPESITVRVHTQGTVKPRVLSNLSAEVAGRVVEVADDFIEGGFFEEGDVLLRIDPRDYELALAQSRLEVASARRHLEEVEADAAVARKEWDAHGEGQASPLTLHEPQLAEARAALAAAESKVESAERDLGRTVIGAPYAGRVLSTGVDRGQFVGRGQALAQVYAVDYAEVRLPLADTELAFLDLPLGYRGEKLTSSRPKVLLEAEFGGEVHEWQAEIVRTEGEIDPMTRMVMAVARVEDPYGRGEMQDRPPLSMGMFVEAEITGKTFDAVYVLPRTAMRGKSRVYLLDRRRRLEFRQVDILRSERDRVLVRGGLEPGDQVIVSPLDVVTEGSRLQDVDFPIAHTMQLCIPVLVNAGRQAAAYVAHAAETRDEPRPEDSAR